MVNSSLPAPEGLADVREDDGLRSRCLLADDHPGVTASLAELLRDRDFEIVGPADSGTSALALAEAAPQPDCALVDYRMPGLGGAPLVRSLRDAAPEMAIVVYTGEHSDGLAEEALDAGASAVLLKEAPLADVLRALAVVRTGDRYVDPALLPSPTGKDETLSRRERDVLELVADGRSYRDAGAVLGIGEETVRSHLKKACLRLGAATRTQAVATALRRGLIE